MDSLASLNDAQRRAAEHLDGPLLVVAGAGTGKTKVITTRMAHLIDSGQAKPEDILALTFTEKAAAEMAERLSGAIGWRALGAAVMTFNAFGSRLLVEYAHHIGRSVKGGLLTETQKSLLLLHQLDGIKLDYFGPQADTYGFVMRIVDYIGRLQNAGVSPQRYADYVAGLVPNEQWAAADIAEQVDLSRLYRAYDEAKAATGTYDYYDQLALPLEILQQQPHLAARLAKRYKYILVDEYQDTSPVQDALLREIVPAGGNLFAVGDDDQAIYGFRGADINNILNFTEHYHVKIPVALTQNYRSGQPILDAAYRLIGHNSPDRLEDRLQLDKRLMATTDEAEARFVAYATPSAELDAVVGQIMERLAAGEAAGSLAVLARSNVKLRDIARRLRTGNVPYAISTSINIFEQRELIQLWYVLEWIGLRASEEAIGHIIVGPYVGWPIAAWQVVAQTAKDTALGIEAALEAVANEGHVEAQVLLRRLAVWREWALELGVNDVAYRVVFEATADETTLGQRLQDTVDPANVQSSQRVFRVFDDLARFYSQIQDYVGVQELLTSDKSLAGYLAAFPVPPSLEVSETDGEADGVQLLTVHASKGLEFKTVWLINTTERAWSDGGFGGGMEVPAELALRNDLPPIHEQRRLMYVAVTRAKFELIISAPVASEGGQKQRVSQLVEELLGHEPDLTVSSSKVQDTHKSLQKIQRYAPLVHQLPERMPYEREDGWITMGVSDLYAYSEDPHSYMLERILQLGQGSSWKMQFGILIHHVIQTYYDGIRLDEVPSRAELLQRVSDGWNGRGFDTPGQAETALALARDTIGRFYDREQLTTRVIEAIEYPITLELPEAKLRLYGRIDAMFQLADGIEIRDFKTGDQRDPEKLADKAKTSFQLRTYALALEILTGTPPALVTLDYVVTGAEGSAKLTPAILKNHRDKLTGLAERLRARDFTAKPGMPGYPTLAERYYGEGDDD